MWESEENIRIIQAQFEQKLSGMNERREQLQKWKGEYESVLEMIRTLPEKVAHKVMVPLGGNVNKVGMMEGEIYRTNEYICHLGQNYFAVRSATQAKSILQRRFLYLSEQIEKLENEFELVKSKLTFSSTGENNIRDSKGDDKMSSFIPPETKIEKIGNTELYHHDGFVEIHEPVEDSDLSSHHSFRIEEKIDQKMSKDEERDLEKFLQKLSQLEQLEKANGDDESVFDSFDFGISKASNQPSIINNNNNNNNNINDDQYVPLATKTNQIANPADIFAPNNSNINKNNSNNSNNTIKDDNADFTPILLTQKKEKKEKKKVSFSEDVQKKEIPKTPSFNSAFTGVIIERQTDEEKSKKEEQTISEPPKRVSRFKAQRNNL